MTAPAPPTQPSPPPVIPTIPRIAAIDAFRGFVMFLMLAEVLHLAAVARKIPATEPSKEIWLFLAHQQTHVEWEGCTLHDLIQPSFSFLVGVALPFSLASRAERGQKFGWKVFHALWRAGLLVWLGVFLRSVGKPSDQWVTQTNWIFTDTLSQIGLGYFFLFLLGHVKVKWQWLAFLLIVVGYWIYFASYPPDTQLPFDKTGVKAGWTHDYTGFAAHWNKNTNAAAAFDRWFLNLFPREKPFEYNSGGYATLSFIPTLATMILGLIAGQQLMRFARTSLRFWNLFGTGLVLLLLGYGVGQSEMCPVVKRIWTPSWVLFSGGWCFLILSAFYATTDWSEWSRWTFPLRVIGANSILIYCIHDLLAPFILGSFKTHLGPDVFQVLGPWYEPFVAGATVMTVYWLLLLWMYQRRVFVRI